VVFIEALVAMVVIASLLGCTLVGGVVGAGIGVEKRPQRVALAPAPAKVDATILVVKPAERSATEGFLTGASAGVLADLVILSLLASQVHP
jgi:hypothetical protein